MQIVKQGYNFSFKDISAAFFDRIEEDISNKEYE